MDNKKNKNIKYSGKIISTVLLAPALTNVVAYASIADQSIVDERTKLESSVNIAESFVNSIDLTDNEDKKILSTDLLKPALNAALIILNNEESSIEDIVRTNSILNRTLFFIENTQTVKKSELELSSRLHNIKKFISEAEESNDENKYPIAAIEILSQKVDYCEELLKDRLLVSDDLMNINAMTIDESVKDFKEAALLDDVDKSELNALILLAEDFQNNRLFIGVRKGDYHKADVEEFWDLLTVAREMAEEDFVTDAESVAKMVKDLQDLMDEMPSRKITEDNVLQDKIDEVEIFIKDIVYGNDLGNYSEDAKPDLERLLAEAKENVDNEEMEGHMLYQIYEKFIEAFEHLKSTKVLEVDKTELKALIEDAERLYTSIVKGDRPGEYYEADYNELRAEIDKAIVVSENKQASLELVTTTHSNLQSFKNNFSSKEITYESIKRTELETILDEGRKLYNANTMNVGFDKGQYLPDELEKLYDEIQLADVTFSTQTASQNEVNAAKDKLVESVENFKNSLITANKTKLKNSLEKAFQTLNDTVVGSESGQYPEEANKTLQSAYDKAMNIYKTVHFEANQAEIDNEASILDLAIDSYLKSIIVDFDSLLDMIEKAQLVYDVNLDNVGVDLGNCSEEALSKLLEAIEKATSVYEKEFVTQEEVNTAQFELEGAMDTFNNSIVNVDKSKLKESLDKAKDLIDNTQVGNNPGEYPQMQRDILCTQFEYANLIYLTEHHNGEPINSATINLNKAIVDYENSVVKDENEDSNGGSDNDNSDSNGANPELDYILLNSSISQAENIIASPNAPFLENYIKEVEASLEVAKNIKYSAIATQDEVDNAQKDLDAKIKSFREEETNLINTYYSKLSDLIAEAEKLVSKYEATPPSNGDSELILRTLDSLKESIEDSKLIIESKPSDISDYVVAYDELKLTKDIFHSLVYGESNDNNNNGNVEDEDNSNNGNIEDENDDTISEEEGLLVEEYKEKIENLLVEIKIALSTTEVGFNGSNCSENNKRATMYMYKIIEASIKDCERITETKDLYSKANATLLDFTNRTISITESGVVNGKNLTGIVKNLTKVPVGEVISYEEEFIPNAGIPIDIKAWMTVVGSSFVGLGAFFKRKK